jgi:phage N-6-adenine-methyltransferase
VSDLAYHRAPVKFDWETPHDFFAKMDAEFGFTLDVCATAENAKCARYFTPEDDGLAQSWGSETCWMNPPYGSAIARWMAKAVRESQRGATVVCLVPSRTDTGWWHDHATRGEIRFIRGRLRFLTGGVELTHATRSGPAPAPFPCAVVVFRAALSPSGEPTATPETSE